MSAGAHSSTRAAAAMSMGATTVGLTTTTTTRTTPDEQYNVPKTVFTVSLRRYVRKCLEGNNVALAQLLAKCRGPDARQRAGPPP